MNLPKKVLRGFLNVATVNQQFTVLPSFRQRDGHWFFIFIHYFCCCLKHFFGLSSVGETKLHLACIKNNSAKVKQLLTAGEDANSIDNVGWTPLHEACYHGNLECVRELLKNRQPVLEINSEDGRSCFQ